MARYRRTKCESRLLNFFRYLRNIVFRSSSVEILEKSPQTVRRCVEGPVRNRSRATGLRESVFYEWRL